MQRLCERKIGTLKTGRLIEGGRLIQGHYIQVRLYVEFVFNGFVRNLFYLDIWATAKTSPGSKRQKKRPAEWMFL